MADTINLFTGASGLHTKIDPVRIRFNGKTGISDLSSAVNVVIDNTGRVSRRKGFNQKEAGEDHSMWCDGGDCFFIRETATYGSIMQVGTDLTSTGIWSGLVKDSRMSFLDWNGDTLYANGHQHGIIIDGVRSAWPIGTYDGPTTSRQFSPAPIGSHLANVGGDRVVIAEGTTLWFSEPNAVGLFWKVLYWPLPTRIRMVKSVDSGLFVSDEKNTYFLSGKSPLDFKQKRIASYPAYEWSVAHDMVELDDLDLGEDGLGIVWSSPKGLCIGLPSGRMINLTKERLDYPTAYNKGACLVCGYHVINTMY